MLYAGGRGFRVRLREFGGVQMFDRKRLVALCGGLLLVGAWSGMTEAAAGSLKLKLIGEPVDVDEGETTNVGGISVAFNSVDGEYCVVWYDSRIEGQNDVYAQRVSTAGSLLGGDVTIICDAASQTDTSVAYSPVDNRYLMTWHYQNGPPGSPGFNHTYGAIASAAGGLLTDPIDISNGGLEPTLVYNSAGNEYFLEARNFAGGGVGGIRGQRVSSEGKLIGSGIAIATAGAPAPAGQVAYNSNADQYLATWRDQSASDLKGRVINADGSFATSGKVISPIFPESGLAATVAFDPVNDRYLVVFATFCGGPVYGQFLGPGMEPIGEALVLVDGSARYAPFIGYDNHNAVYLLTWRNTDVSKLSVRLLDDDGTLLGDEVVIAGGFASDGPRVAVNVNDGGFIVTWEDSSQQPARHDVLVQVLAVVQDADVTGDGVVDVLDLLAVLSGWGP